MGLSSLSFLFAPRWGVPMSLPGALRRAKKTIHRRSNFSKGPRSSIVARGIVSFDGSNKGANQKGNLMLSCENCKQFSQESIRFLFPYFLSPYTFFSQDRRSRKKILKRKPKGRLSLQSFHSPPQNKFFERTFDKS